MPNDAQGGDVSRQPGYETRDANIRWTLLFMLIVLVTCTIVYGVVHRLMGALENRAASADRQMAQEQVSMPPVYFPFPREQPSGREDLQAYRSRESQELDSYGWLDRKTGIVRIPIARAMDLMLQKGLPTRGSNNAGAGPSNLQLQQQRPNGASSSQEGEK